MDSIVFGLGEKNISFLATHLPWRAVPGESQRSQSSLRKTLLESLRLVGVPYGNGAQSPPPRRRLEQFSFVVRKTLL